MQGLWATTLVLLGAAALAASKDSRPNIVLLALDDIGWADVSYHGSNFPTPNIDALAASGVKLDRMYAMPQCSPTRSALLTGRYAFRIGMQHFSTIFPGASAGIPFDTPTVAEVLKKANYSTHMVGKWHLGYSSWAQTPTRRGFDSYLGYLQGQTDYYNRTMPSCGKALCLFKGNTNASGFPATHGSQADGYDFWDNERAAVEQFGTYTSDSYNTRVDDIISESAHSDRPLFLYYAEQQLHIPIEAPPGEQYMEACRGVTGGSELVNRTVLCSMASKLDESVGKLVSSLHQHGLWNNTLIWAVSDNGGMTHWGENFPASASSNWPLRGGKTTLFEGGVRSVSFLAGGYVPQSAPSSYDSLLHVSDVLPTLAHVAGAELPAQIGFDGLDAWGSIVGQGASAVRTEIPLNIDTNPMSMLGGPSLHPLDPSNGQANFSALISWPWKLVLGVSCNPGIQNAADTVDGWWGIQNYTREMPPKSDGTVLLFNLEADEAERNDVASAHPDVVKNMTDRIQHFWASKDHGFTRSQLNLPLPLANPKYHNWTWSPFRPSFRHSQFSHVAWEQPPQESFIEH